jgi:diaminohydroxyphosphoribosylaminopyrimidine deaminase/5-amino-6-(5-phosphoribosylamino)uracil reductase
MPTLHRQPGPWRAPGRRDRGGRGLLGDEAWRLNEPSSKEQHRPASSSPEDGHDPDGKIATAGGESRYISGEVSRAEVQQLRAESAAAMVGINTVRHDPRLDARVEGAHQPARVIVDPLAATSPEARLFDLPGPVYLAVGPAAPGPARAALVARGAMLELPEPPRDARPRCAHGRARPP